MNMWLNQQFSKIPGTGMPLQDLQLFKQYIQQASGGQNYKEAQEALIQMQQNTNFVFHLQSLLESLYHYDDISKINPEFNDIVFEQMLIYASILIQNLMTKEQQLLSQEGIALLYITTVHLVTKYSGIKNMKKHLIICLSRINGLIQNLQIDLYTSLFDVLFEYILQQCQQPQPSNLISTLMIMESLVQFEFKQIHDKFNKVMQQIFLQLDDYQLLGGECIMSVSQLLVALAQKYTQFDPEQLIVLTHITQITSFIHRQCQITSNNLQCRGNLLKFVAIIEDQSSLSEVRRPMNDQYLTLLVSLIPQLLDQYVQVGVEDVFGEYFRLQILELIYHTLDLSQLYNFYHLNAQLIFSVILLENLVTNTEERNNFIENPTDYYTLQKQLVKGKKIETLKGYSALLLCKLCQKIDGCLPFVCAFMLEYLTHLISPQQEDVIVKSRQFCTQYEKTSFFAQPDELKLDILLLIVSLLHDEITTRKDLRLTSQQNYTRKAVETFIRLQLSYFSKYPDSFIKARIILMLKFYLPKLFKRQEAIFTKCVKFYFKLLSTQNNKSKCLKIFAIDALCSLVDDEDTNLRMESSLIDNMNDFCHYLTYSNTESYYKFVTKVLRYTVTSQQYSSYQSIIDQFLAKIMGSIVQRLRDTFKAKKEDAISQFKQKKKAGTHISNCLNLVSRILSFQYCLETQSAQLEPSLLEVCSIFLEQEKYQMFLDEALDVLTVFIAHAKGMTDILYRIYDHLPHFIAQKNKVTITTVFQLYYTSITQCQEVVKTRPLWIKLIINHSLGLLNVELLDNVKNDCSDFIKIMIILNALLQNLPQLIVEYIPTIVNQMSILLGTLAATPGLKQLTAKVLHSIYTPYIYDNTLIDGTSQMIILSTIQHIKEAYSGPQTIYNYKLLFQVNNFLIVNSYKIWQPSELHEVCYQLLVFTIQQIVAYIDKVNFSQKIGSVNFTQKASKNIHFLQHEQQPTDEEEMVVPAMKQLNESLQGEFITMMLIYKREKEVESLVNIDLLPLAQQDLEPVRQIVEFLKANLPTVLQALSEEQAHTLKDLLSTYKLLNQSLEVEFRRIFRGGQRRKII